MCFQSPYFSCRTNIYLVDPTVLSTAPLAVRKPLPTADGESARLCDPSHSLTMTLRAGFTTGDRAVKKSTRRLVIGGLILAVAVLNAYGPGTSRMAHFAGNSHLRAFGEAPAPVSF
jgi:hypothetical protein